MHPQSTRCAACHGYGQPMRHDRYCPQGPASPDCGGSLSMGRRCSVCDGTGRSPQAAADCYGFALDRDATVADRLEYLRSQIEAERISYLEIAELQEYAAQGKIDPSDAELLEWAGVSEEAYASGDYRTFGR